MSDSRKQASPFVWIAGGCGVMVALYLLLSCVLPLVMYGVMALNQRSGGGGSVPAMPASTPFDLGPPSSGGPMLPIDPSEAAALDAGAGPSAMPTVEPSPPVS